jgi:hypothetical protein
LSDKAREAVQMHGGRIESAIFEGMAMAVQKKGTESGYADQGLIVSTGDRTE